METKEDMDIWKSRRKTMFITICYLIFLHCCELSIINAGLWSYLTEVVKVENPKFAFSALQTTKAVFSIISNLTISRYTDRSRKVKQTLLILCSLSSIGNILYSVSSSWLFPLVGMILIGFAFARHCVMIGELVRCYPIEQTTSVISTTLIFCKFAVPIAPLIFIALPNIDFYFFIFRITSINFVSLLIATLWGVSILIVGKYLTNVSLYYDLKSDLRKENDPDFNTQNEIVSKNRSSSPLELLSRFDFSLIMYTIFFKRFAIKGATTLAVPMITTTLYNYSVSDLSILFAINGFCNIFTLSIIRLLTRRGVNDLSILLAGMALSIIGLELLNLTLIISDIKFGTVIIVLHTIIFSAGCTAELLCSTIAAKMVNSSTQSLAEGLQQTFSELGGILSSLVVPIFIDHYAEINYLNVLMLIIGIALLIRRRGLIIKAIT